MRVVCCQLDIEWENKPANWAKVGRLLLDNPVPPGALLVLPEMFATGFSMNAGQICEGDSSPTEAVLVELAALHRIYVLAGLARLGTRGERVNQAVAFSPEGEVLARYNKMRPFSFGGEGEHYQAGEEVAVFAWGQVMVAPFVCYDLRFPELFRRAVAKGAQLFAVLANWPAVRTAHWVALLQARAIENQAYVAGVNRCGRDPHQSYSGRSLIVDPLGEIVAEGGGAQALVSGELDLEGLLAWRKEFPALRDMAQAESRGEWEGAT